MIQIVPVLMVDHCWPALADGMEEACKRGGGQFTPGWLHTVCRTGEAYLVADADENGIKAGVVCREENWSGRVVLNVLAACGRDLPSWLPDILEWAKLNLRVESIMFEGRPGWERAIPQAHVLRRVYEVRMSDVGR